MLAVEFMALGVALAFAVLSPRSGESWLRRVERSFRRFSRRRRRAVLAVGLLALAGRAALLPVTGLPEPQVHDEFSHLLAADTFASGRLTNPTHPHWVHFESFHVDQRPTYMSMYPPGQGIFLASGILLGGHAWLGVWIACALACAAICWMLQGWLPPQWALLGGLVAVARLGLFSYWADSYWGGAVPALGGALVLGALPRAWRRPAVAPALVLALGLAILAQSRPYEGLVLGAGAGVASTWVFVRRRGSDGWTLLTRLVLPAGSLLALVLGAMLHSNSVVFGNPLSFPYQVNRDTHALAGYFVWEDPKPEPEYRHPVIRDFYVGWEMRHFEASRTAAGYVGLWYLKLAQSWMFYVGPLLTPALLMLPLCLRDARLRMLVVIGGVSLLGSAVQVWFNPHYAAPYTALFYAFLLQGMRHLRIARLGVGPAGAALVGATLALGVALIGVRILAEPLGLAVRGGYLTWFGTQPPTLARRGVLDVLEREGGLHLVLVRYGPAHDPHHEYVYNRADIDGSDVVWAREMDAERNQRLRGYFQDRRAWLLEADADPLRLSPYPARARPAGER
jgi:hypothetical protein